MSAQIFDFSSLPGEAQAIVTTLRKKKIPFWLVGGFVRDWIGGCTIRSDVDICAACDLDRLTRLLRGDKIICRVSHVERGNVDIIPSFDLRKSLDGRDFTVNAMAIDERGRLVDPFNGRKDAQDHLFRRSPGISFYDDPMRMLRACRLAARLDWTIEADTASKIQKQAKKLTYHYMTRAHGVRLALELRKALSDPQPSKFFKLCHRFKLLRIILPSAEKYFSSLPQEKLQAFMDACDQPGDFNKRLATIMRTISRDDALLGKEGKKCLARHLEIIKWDLVASDFGRSKRFIPYKAFEMPFDFTPGHALSQKDLYRLSKAGLNKSVKLRTWLNASAYMGETDFTSVSYDLRQRFLQIATDVNEQNENRKAALVFAGASRKKAGKLLHDSAALKRYIGSLALDPTGESIEK